MKFQCKQHELFAVLLRCGPSENTTLLATSDAPFVTATTTTTTLKTIMVTTTIGIPGESWQHKQQQVQARIHHQAPPENQRSLRLSKWNFPWTEGAYWSARISFDSTTEDFE
jgi:hypothetical protein